MKTKYSTTVDRSELKKLQIRLKKQGISFALWLDLKIKEANKNPISEDIVKLSLFVLAFASTLLLLRSQGYNVALALLDLGGF